MGIAYSGAKKAVRNWNATNKAIRFIDRQAVVRSKPQKPIYFENGCEIEKELLSRDPGLENRVTSFNITSHTVKDSIIPDGFEYVPKSSRKLPQRTELGSPIPPPNIEYGFAVPEFIPTGQITMRQGIQMVKAYQLNEKTVTELATAYKLDEVIVSSICKYFSLFVRENAKMWVPAVQQAVSQSPKLVEKEIASDDERAPAEVASRYIRNHELLNK